MRYVLAVVVLVMVCGVAYGLTTFEVVNGVAVITETAVNQPVQYMGQDNKTVNVPGATRDVTTKITVTKSQAQMQVIQLNAQRAQKTNNYKDEMRNLEAQIKLLKDIDTALPEESVQPIEETPIEG